MSWKQTLTAAVAAAIAAPLAAGPIGAPPAAAQSAEGVAAIVNDAVISTYDVRQRANLLLLSAGVQSSPEMRQRASSQALRELIDERLQLQETKEFDITITPDEINRRIADIARQNNSTAEAFTQQLAAAGVGVSTLQTQIEADVAWQRLMNGLYGTRVRISDLEIRETQARITANATRPQYLISEIFLAAENEQQLAELQTGAMRLLEEMQRGAPFPLVARQFSSAPSAAAGGDIGWISVNELAPEVQTVVGQLQPGQVSLPVRTPDGIYIIAVRDRRAGADLAAATRLTLRQITAPASSRGALERAAQRIENCNDLARAVSSVQGAEIADLGEAAASDLSDSIRSQVIDLEAGRAGAVQIAGDQAAAMVVCARETGGAGVPSRQEIENSLFEQELAMLSERYLRNLRREATIITR